MAGEKEKVCLTGAGGFATSWVVKLLLSQDYLVHGTVRQPGELIAYLLKKYEMVQAEGDRMYDHLNKLEKASENLKLFKVLLDYESLCPAFLGCSSVFHTASSVPITTVTNPEAEILEPAVKGTLNVLKACLEAKVKRVVVVSSTTAVVKNPNWPNNQVKDDSCWLDPEYNTITLSTLSVPFTGGSIN